MSKKSNQNQLKTEEKELQNQENQTQETQNQESQSQENPNQTESQTATSQAKVESSPKDQEAGSKEKPSNDLGDLGFKPSEQGITGKVDVKQFVGMMATASNVDRLFQDLLSKGRLERPRAIAIEIKRRGFFVDYETE